MNLIKGADDLKELKTMEGTTDKEVKVGEGLLSARNKRREVDIPRNMINKNPMNRYSIDGVSGLAETIRIRGLIQRVEVKPEEDGTYTLLGGERRITAIDTLISDPDVPEWTEESLIPCIISNLDDIDLKLSNKNKERFAIMSTNAWNRKYSNSDRINELEDWKEIIEELRANGVEKFIGYDEDGNEQEIQIKGENTRDILSKTTGASRGIINNVEYVQNNGSQALREAMLSNQVSISTAAKAAKELKEDEQTLLAKASENESVTIKDISKFKTKREGTIISTKSFRKDIKKINDILKDSEIILDETALKQYYFYINKIEQIIRGQM